MNQKFSFNLPDDEFPVLTEIVYTGENTDSENSALLKKPEEVEEQTSAFTPSEEIAPPSISFSLEEVLEEEHLSKPEFSTRPIDEPTPAAQYFPFELLLVSDESSPDNLQDKEHPQQINEDALNRIEQRLAAIRSAAINLPQPSLTPSQPTERPTKQLAVLGETALTEALYQAVLPRIKAEVMGWLQELLTLQTKQLCEGVIRQFKTDYEVMFGDALRDSLRKAVSDVRRQPMKKTYRK